MDSDVSIATVNATTKSLKSKHRHKYFYSNHNKPNMYHTKLGQHGEIRDLTSLVSSVNFVKSLGMLQRNVTEPKKSYLELQQQTIQMSLLQQIKNGLCIQVIHIMSPVTFISKLICVFGL